MKIEIKIYEADFDGEVKPQSEIERAEYFAYHELPKLPDIGMEFLNDLKSEGLIN